MAVIANEVKQSSGFVFWIAASATPPRNDEGILDCRVGYASAALRSQLKPCCNDESILDYRFRRRSAIF
jgi:hypothetical protein